MTASEPKVLPRLVARLRRFLLLEVLALRPRGLELPPGRYRRFLLLMLVVGYGHVMDNNIPDALAGIDMVVTAQ